ncbi:MAG TPA: hypothetical protein GX717_04445 [Clostridiaceae bacterium]|nr:hypothetical protein [Clostridiaceae bacterium]
MRYLGETIGADAAIHGNANRPSPRRLPQDLVDKILNLRMLKTLSRSNFTHFHEILFERYNLDISYSAVYRLLTDAGIKSPKSRRKREKLHPQQVKLQDCITLKMSACLATLRY